MNRRFADREEPIQYDMENALEETMVTRTIGTEREAPQKIPRST